MNEMFKKMDVKKCYVVGVLKYVQMGYWEFDYSFKDIDVIVLFCIMFQDGVDVIEVVVVVVGESSIVIWIVVWIDCLIVCEKYCVKVYCVDLVLNLFGEYFVYIVYDLDLFELGSIVNLIVLIIGNVFGFKFLKVLWFEDMCLFVVYVKMFQGFVIGIVVECEWLNVFGCLLLGVMVKFKLGLLGCNYGCVVYEVLKGGLDFIKDDENINSQFFMYWCDCFFYCMEVVNCVSVVIGEVKGMYLNVIVVMMEDMYECVEFVKLLGSVIVMIDFVIGYMVIQLMVKWVWVNDMILYLYCVGYLIYICQCSYGVSFCVIVKWMWLVGVDYLYVGIVVGKLEGDFVIIKGYYDIFCEE